MYANSLVSFYKTSSYSVCLGMIWECGYQFPKWTSSMGVKASFPSYRLKVYMPNEWGEFLAWQLASHSSLTIQSYGRQLDILTNQTTSLSVCLIFNTSRLCKLVAGWLVENYYPWCDPIQYVIKCKSISKENNIKKLNF